MAKQTKNMLRALHNSKLEGFKTGVLSTGELISGALWNANCELNYLSNEQLNEFQKRVKYELEEIMKGCYSNDINEVIETVETVVAKCEKLRNGESI